MIHEIYPEFFIYGSDAEQKRRLVHKAALVIAVSECTKRDIVQLLGVPPEKVVVIYHGNSLEAPALEDATPRAELPAKYLLFVGNRGLYKNFYFFMQAIAPLLAEDKDLQVVCTGTPLDEPEKQLLRSYGLQERIFHVSANDQMLISLYRNALAFVFPSLYEGFGIPVLEAFANGCPVLVSNTSSLPEVGGDAVRYFAPKEAVSIREAVQAVLDNDRYREELVAKGYGQLSKFSWESMAKQTQEAYRRVLAGE
jgi:glycosyltransferase involved in cell wall biosynthesis